MDFFRLCETAGFLRTLYILKVVIRVVFIVVPLLMIILTSIDVYKAAISGKAEDLTAIIPKTVKKFIAAAVVFFIPTIFTAVFSLVGEDLNTAKVCFENATRENIQYYTKIEPITEALEVYEKNPNQKNLDRVQKLISEASGYIRNDTMANYQIRIGEAQRKGAEKSLREECEAKHGTYSNGACTLPAKVNIAAPSGGGSSSSGSSGSTSGAVVNYDNSFNGEYKVANTSTSVQSYLNTISSRRITQDSDSSKYGDLCLAFAYVHAYSMFSGNTSAGAEEAAKYQYAYKFKSYTSDNKQDVLTNIYNQINSGRPCVLQVNGNKQGTSRHYVTVVGFKKKITSASQLTEDDLVIIDSWDGKLERMDTSDSRFMTTGKSCGWSSYYTGYQMYYINE